MSTAVATASSNIPLSFSIGPVKIQILSVAVVSGDDGATVTASRLSSIDEVLVMGGPVTLTAQPTISGNVATLAFTDPVADRFLKVICLGK